MNENQNSNACVHFGSFVRERRRALGKTARNVALAIGMKASNFCNLELGVDQPPSHPAKLGLLADALELPSGKSLTHQFYDLAGKALSAVPADIADIISRQEATPMMLRTLGCRKLTPDDIEQIITIIRSRS